MKSRLATQMSVRSAKEARIKFLNESLEYNRKHIEPIDKRVEMNKRHLNIVDGMIKDTDISFVVLKVFFSALIIGGALLIVLKIYGYLSGSANNV